MWNRSGKDCPKRKRLSIISIFMIISSPWGEERGNFYQELETWYIYLDLRVLASILLSTPPSSHNPS
jgi:hypothetical protein